MSKNKSPDDAVELAKIAAPIVGCSFVQARLWIRTNTEPHNPLVAVAWAKALARAKQRLARRQAMQVAT